MGKVWNRFDFTPGILTPRQLAVSKDEIAGTHHVPLSVGPVIVQGAVDVMGAVLQDLFSGNN